MLSQILGILAAAAGFFKSLSSLLERRKDQQLQKKLNSLKDAAFEGAFLKKTMRAREKIEGQNDNSPSDGNSSATTDSGLQDDKYRRD